jgi:hypothetical protein
MKKEIQKAQVLLLTLIILSVMGVLIIGTIIIFRRDSGQVINTEKYQRILNVAETDLIRVAEEYASPSSLIENIVSDARFQDLLSGCAFRFDNQSQKSTTCKSVSNETNELNLETEIQLVDSKDIENLTIYKDQPLQVALSGYKSIIYIQVDDGTPLELSISYLNQSTGLTEILRAFVDKNRLLNSSTISGNLSPYISFPESGVINLSLQALPSNYSTINFEMTIRINSTENESTQVSIRPSSYTDFPYQIRNFKIKSFDSLSVSTPVVQLSTSSLINSESSSFLDYPLLIGSGFVIE